MALILQLVFFRARQKGPTDILNRAASDDWVGLGQRLCSGDLSLPKIGERFNCALPQP